MIGNGPSISKTDLTVAADYEKFCFNWFILHEAFDIVRPEHLVLGSHQFFGGWNTQAPNFPDGYLDRLLGIRHRPVIWTCYYFKPLFERVGLDREFEINYCLFEKPFKRFVDKLGYYNADIDGYLDDSRTGVLSLGIPAAISMGFQRILLVGCDSNYNQTGVSSKYFYDTKKHTSLETDQRSLTATWTEAGRGQIVYRLASESLAERGVELVDCTVDGALTEVPMAKFETFRKVNEKSGLNGGAITAPAIGDSKGNAALEDVVDVLLGFTNAEGIPFIDIGRAIARGAKSTISTARELNDTSQWEALLSLTLFAISRGKRHPKMLYFCARACAGLGLHSKGIVLLEAAREHEKSTVLN